MVLVYYSIVIGLAVHATLLGFELAPYLDEDED